MPGLEPPRESPRAHDPAGTRSFGVRGWVPAAWVAGLALLVTAPLLLPGFVLSYDLVFTPRQDLLPASLGLGGALPRAVPQDAVVAILSTVIPGMLLEKAVLLAIPLLSGLGMVRLLRRAPVSARVVGATLAVWNPYIAERLVIGHWGLLLAYALTPWALNCAVEMRRGTPGAQARLVLLVAAGSLTPSGWALVALLCVPVGLLPGSAASPWRRAAVGVGAAALAVPWALPALLTSAAVPPAGTAAGEAAAVFALRSEGPWGPVLTALGTGGLWNADAVVASRAWITAPIVAIVLVALAIVGWRALEHLLGRAAVRWWTGLAGLGLALALASAMLPGAWQAALGWSPGLGLLRDAQKLLAPLTLLVAASAGVGVALLVARIGDRSARAAVVVLAAVVPIAVLPDLAWGAGGRLAPAHYPAEWAAVRSTLQAEPRSGDVLVLPWSAFRDFDWNRGRTVLDPAPRWLPRPSVVDDGLAVMTRDGVVTLQGEDPRARAISRALAAGAPLADILASNGIGWVLVEKAQSPPVPESAVKGLTPVLDSPTLALLATPGPVADQSPAPGTALVIAADLLVLGSLAVWGILAVAGPTRRRPGSPSAAAPPTRRRPRSRRAGADEKPGDAPDSLVR